MRSRKILTLIISTLMLVFLIAWTPMSANRHAIAELSPEETAEPVAYLPVIINNYCPDYFDDFSNPASGWPVGEDDDLRTEYLDGEYRTLTKNNRIMYPIAAPNCDRVNYVLEVDARWVGAPGASYGLIFGITGSPDEFYLFHMNTVFREYELLHFDDGNKIVQRSFSDAINPGSGVNHLKVIRDGDQITLEVNGVTLATVTDDKFSGMTGVGILTSPYRGEPTSDARYDNFSVMALPSSSGVVQEGMQRQDQ